MNNYNIKSTLSIVKYKLNNSVHKNYYLHEKGNVTLLFKGDDYYNSFNKLFNKLYSKGYCREIILRDLKKFMYLNLTIKEYNYFYCDIEPIENKSYIEYQKIKDDYISYLIEQDELTPEDEDYDIQLEYIYLSKLDFYKGIPKD